MTVARLADADRPSIVHPRPVWARHYQTGLIAVGIVLGYFVVAAAVVRPSLTPVLGLIGLVAAGLVVRRWPIVGMTVLLVLVASALPERLILVPAGPFELRGYELAVLGMFLLAAVEPRKATWGGRAGGALFVFLGLVAASALLAVSAGKISMSDAFNGARVFALLLIFPIILRLFPTRRELDQVLLCAVVIASLTGILAIILATGRSVPAIFGASGADFTHTEASIAGSVNRVRLPGTALAYVLFIPALVQLVRSRGMTRLGWAAAVAGMGINIALSFNRNMWIGIAIGLIVLLVLGDTRMRRSFAIGAGTIACAIALALLSGAQVDRSSVVYPIVQRGETLFSPGSVERESSLRDRDNESALAWRAFSGKPLTGIGAGVPFGATYAVRQPNGRYRPGAQLFVHNQYLYLLLIAGVPGLIAFSVFLLTVLGLGFTHRLDHDVLAWTISIGMMALSAVVMLTFAGADTLTALCVIAGAIVAVAGATPMSRVDG